MITRESYSELKENLEEFPSIGILGPRQVGKTTLAKSLLQEDSNYIYLDLERPSDLAKLQNAELFFELNRDKRIILDEVQRMPELFPLLRSEIDAYRGNGRFVLLGSASPDLLRTSSESLAGRIVYHELNPLSLRETQGIISPENLWLYGGFPEPALKSNKTSTWKWYSNFIRTYIERDLPMLGLNTTSIDLNRLFTMLAHEAGQQENDSKLALALGVKSPTIKNALNYLEQAFLIRRIPAWFSNAKKRVVKAPKLYFRDTGILHSNLGIETMPQLLGHPITGFSFETFAINSIISNPKYFGHQFYYYRTQDGTECDLIAVKNNEIIEGFEFKMSSNPTVTKSMKNAIEDLDLPRLTVVTPNSGNFPIDRKIQVKSINEL